MSHNMSGSADLLTDLALVRLYSYYIRHNLFQIRSSYLTTYNTYTLVYVICSPIKVLIMKVVPLLSSPVRYTYD